MAVDLKIELFAMDLFRNLWFKNGMLSFIPARLNPHDNQKSENSIEAVHAVWCRKQMFQQSLYKKIWDDFPIYSSSGVDFYLYVQNNALQCIPYQLNVFDKLFTTCAFVLEMANCLSFNADTAYIYFAPPSWSMFFDSELKIEFYFEGGWEILKKYATSYSTNILSTKWVRSICDRSDDLENVKALLESANKFFHISRLFKEFAKRHKKRKNKMVITCLRCLPMFLVFKTIVFPDEKEFGESILIEGYLQIILRMLTDEEIGVRRKEFFDSLHRNDSSSESDDFRNSDDIPDSDDIRDSDDARNSDDHESTNSSTEEDETDSGNPEEIIDKVFKNLTTDELINRLFVDEAYIKVECSCGVEPCIFCGRVIDSKIFVKRETPSVHIERIKSTIAKVLDMEAVNEAAAQNTTRRTSDEKKILRLFTTLGLNPMQSHMLSIMKNRTKQEDKRKKDIEHMFEIFTNFKLPDTPTKSPKNKSKRKKSNKK